MEEDYEKVRDWLVMFAIFHPTINSVYRGVDPEEGNLTYFFLAEGPYNGDLADMITELDIKIKNQTEHRCDLMGWPITKDLAGDYGFLQECIWDRDCD